MLLSGRSTMKAVSNQVRAFLVVVSVKREHGIPASTNTHSSEEIERGEAYDASPARC
jgi:hypothetical protein